MNEIFSTEEFAKKQDFGKANSRVNFDLTEESFDFKPITEGLGFHKKTSEPKTYKTKAPIRKAASTEFIHPYTMKNESIGKETKRLEEISLNLHSVKTEEAASNISRYKEKAFGFETVSAYILDFIAVSTAFLLINISYKEFLGINLYEYGQKLRELDLLAPWLCLFALCYISYFTLADFSGGFGKALFKLHVRSLNNEKASLVQCFFRSLVSFLSLPLFFVAMIFDFQGKLSETKIVIAHES